MSDPTDTQLANFVCVRVFGPGGTIHRDSVRDLLASYPTLRASWLDEHRRFQEQLKALQDDLAPSRRGQ